MRFDHHQLAVALDQHQAHRAAAEYHRQSPVRLSQHLLDQLDQALRTDQPGQRSGHLGRHAHRPAFEQGQPIPERFTCKGLEHSPALEWEGAPAGTGSIRAVRRYDEAALAQHSGKALALILTGLEELTVTTRDIAVVVADLKRRADQQY